ncbi:putative Ig domain-containing protein [Elstera sp.]|jgi:hypothetical protein|uniref:putative Ig domain-containing protein n=1 Tax=Elstera sp. TaxID=1916664 RepID=UPI0037C03D0E
MLLATRAWLPVGDAPPAWVTTSPLTDAEWEAPYTQTLLATGASVYAIAAGSLPPGLVLAGDTISGSPTPAPSAPAWTTPAGSLGTASQGGGFSVALAASGATSFVVRSGLLPWGVTLDPATGTLAGTLAVIGGPEDSPGPLPVWSTAAGSLGVVWEGQAASLAFGASGADTYEIVGGILPWGLRLDRSTGALTGTPADMGGSGFEPLEPYTWSAPVSSDLGTYAVGASVSITQTATPAGSFYIASGLLPWGLRLARSGGLISGTVNAQANLGVHAFTVGLIDPAGRFGSRAYTITII